MSRQRASQHSSYSNFPHHPQFGQNVNTKGNPSLHVVLHVLSSTFFFKDVSFTIVGGTPNHLCWRGGVTPVTRESLLIERVSRLCRRLGELRTCCPSSCCIRYLGFIARPAAAHSCTTCVEARGEFERTFGGSSQLLGNCARTNEAVSLRIHECEVLRLHQQGRFTSIATCCGTWIEESSMHAQVNRLLGMAERFKMNALDSALRDGACHPVSHATGHGSRLFNPMPLK